MSVKNRGQKSRVSVPLRTWNSEAYLDSYFQLPPYRYSSHFVPVPVNWQIVLTKAGNCSKQYRVLRARWLRVFFISIVLKYFRIISYWHVWRKVVTGFVDSVRIRIIFIRIQANVQGQIFLLVQYRFAILNC